MWYNPLVSWILKSPLHGLLSGSTLLLSYTGRKSGQSHTLPLSYGREGEAVWLITHRDKAWWRNVRGGAPVTVRFQGQDCLGRADVVELSRAAALERMGVVYRGLPRKLAEARVSQMVVVRVNLADS